MVIQAMTWGLFVAVALGVPGEDGDPKKALDAINKSLKDEQLRYYTAISKAQTRRQEVAAMKLKPKTEEYCKKFHDFVRANPKARESLSAISWVAVNSPGSFEADECFRIAAEHHINDPRLPAMIVQIADWPTRATKEFLQAAGENSTVREVGGLSRLVLGSILAVEARAGGKNADAAREQAKTLLNSVSADYAELKLKEGEGYGTIAKSLLAKLDRPAASGIEIGDRAPEIDGTDVNGQSLRLSDSKGSVRVIVVWAHWCMWCHDVYELGRLVKSLSGSRELTLLGINGDGDPGVLKSVIENEGITWKNWPLMKNSEIAESYPTNRYPTTLVLDQRGIVRYRSFGGVDQASIIQAASTLNAEMGSKPAPDDDDKTASAPRKSAGSKRKKQRSR